MNERERLYDLLPAIYRIRDAEEGEVLRALLGVIEEEMQALEQDIAGLYEDLFIETCDEWVIPYIGDLLGVHGVHPLSVRAGSLRSYVANTLAYRRRKGTAAVLEQVARDITGWSAHAVEFFELLATSQHLNHLRPHNIRTPDLRDTNQLELLGGPFESATHTADVRRIATAGGRYNIPNIGIFLWRLQSYPLSRVSACEVPGKGYTFDPTGIDIPLFNRPQTEREIVHLAEEINVPAPLRRRPLYDELEARRQASTNDKTPQQVYFGQQPVFRVFMVIDGTPEEIPPEEILICNLSDWRIPPTEIDYPAPTSTVSHPIMAAVDPVLGRLVLSASLLPDEVLVSHSYGFSGDVGAGPYNRTVFTSDVLNRAPDWQVGVSREETAVGSEKIFKTLSDAVSEWNDQPDGTVGVIVIMDSRTYRDDLTGEDAIRIPESSQLLIIAADWPVVGDDVLVQRRLIGQFAARDLRPHLLGNMNVSGTAGAGSHGAGELVLCGILIADAITVQEGNLGSLKVAHCTLIPGKASIEVAYSDEVFLRNDALKLTVEGTICGGIVLSDAIQSLSVTDCIIDGGGGAALDAMGAAVRIDRSTVIGSSNMRSLQAGNSIFEDVLNVEQRQIGCMRFCVLPYASRTPRRFRCQPDLALANRALRLNLSSAEYLSELEKNAVLARLHPVFTMLNYGEPAYVQLSSTCAEEIRTGAEDSSEMGVFGTLQQPQREANLHAALEEYLRFGLDAGVFYVT
ncbi:MAG: hypothetical protein U9Q37_01270 [Euryarchaeota archaeon]|nr:hypothetical protein [Euryarchaeota archaeon]